MKISGRIAILLSVTVLSVGFAQENEKTLNPWVDCGIGAMIFTETGWAAVTSNIIWDLGTTAVISDQSSQHTCESKRARTALYIGVNYANLTEETAKGDGQHLRTMLDIMQCDAASHAPIIASLREDFSSYLRAPDYAAKSASVKAEEYYDIVQATLGGQYAPQCRTG
ncbi:MAG: DUF3015 domain-containing protein [Gammaproteobacteria bacterium]|nr:DUF3015 domain-containing protein [Gammaproteobacteria bacterium]